MNTKQILYDVLSLTDKQLAQFIKNKKIKDSIQETRKRRESMLCKTYELKIQTNRCSKRTLHTLEMMFLEWKRYKQALIDNDMKDTNIIKTGKWIEYEMSWLSWQMKQEVRKSFLSAIKVLQKLKTKWHKIWKIKNTQCAAIWLKQYWITYKLFFWNKNRWYVKIQKIKQKLPVSWMKQLHWIDEIANATLIKQVDWYFVHVTCYIEKPQKIQKKVIWVDVGMKNQMILSNKTVLTFKQLWLPRKEHRKLSKNNNPKNEREGEANDSINKRKD